MVIAVVALLVALVLPALVRAKTASKRIQSFNNEKQPANGTEQILSFSLKDSLIPEQFNLGSKKTINTGKENKCKTN